MNVDLNLMQHVLTLVNHRNFARDADALHLLQPVVSRSTGRIEAGLGVLLFDRTR
jgi:DNA-binding transcriptional LysR family regulator